MRTLSLVVTLSVGCTAGDPVLEAHQLGAGLAPPNSRTALELAFSAPYEAIHADLSFTADEQVVVHAGPALTGCVDAAGVPGDGVLIAGLTLDEVQEWRCGGRVDPAFPTALVRAEPVMAFSTFVDALLDGPAELSVHLQVHSTGLSAPGFAEAVLGGWFAAEPAQPFGISSDEVEVIGAFRTWAAEAGRDVSTALAVPHGGVGADLAASAGISSLLATLDDPRIDGVILPATWARFEDVRALRRRGYGVQLQVVDGRRALDTHARWPVTSLRTNYPGDR